MNSNFGKMGKTYWTYPALAMLSTKEIDVTHPLRIPNMMKSWQFNKIIS
jgi:hypothetical protein